MIFQDFLYQDMTWHFWEMPFHNKFHGMTSHDMTFKDMTFDHILKILQIPEDTNFQQLSCQLGFIVLRM